jgi:hypothetical protein
MAESDIVITPLEAGLGKLNEKGSKNSGLCTKVNKIRHSPHTTMHSLAENRGPITV